MIPQPPTPPQHPHLPTDFDHRAAARDSLHGLAVGDAFGAQHFVPENRPALAAERLPAAPWPWTDDTEMACSVLAGLHERGRVDGWELGHAFAHHHDFDRGYGPAMNGLLRKVRQGGSASALARALFDGQGSYGNGAAMRVAPLGAWYAVDLAEAAQEAARSAEVTHTHPEAVAGAVAVALAAAVAAGSRGRAITAQEWLRPVLALTPAGKVRDCVAEALELTVRPDAAYAAHRLGNGRLTSAVDTVPFALWCAATHPDSYERALWATASAGGDVDTTCAIVGGILAARLGTEGIPAAWRAAVEPLPDWARAEEPSTDATRADHPGAQPIRRPEPIPVPELRWTPGQWQRVRHGVRSRSMDDRWYSYLDGDQLLLHRSWTGHGIYRVTVSTAGGRPRPVAALVESDEERYRRGDDRYERDNLAQLLAGLFA
ncbi:hypothetical protein CFP65_5881 [Kitasatospora sp. MMS16-BH015]|uniref:ADP-ribosylglycohydrolase family protein n=1 Tax=Kitasatospora sp. MMS16-BH015 TaxID=2018025 RepID=UPI000CA1EA69|nr:hypothetical protein CFP65_5881 [Kitasatospora sp. MMS16-BH015]